MHPTVLFSYPLYFDPLCSSTLQCDMPAQVLRYSLAAHSLLYKEARGHSSLDDLVTKKWLLPHEAATLAPHPSKTQARAVELGHYLYKGRVEAQDALMATDALTCSPVPAHVVFSGLVAPVAVGLRRLMAVGHWLWW